MNTTSKLRAAAVAIAIAMTCGTANAQHWRWHCRPRPVVTVVSRPAVTVHVNNHFTQKERFKIAMAYLKSHSYLTVKKYACMTELSKTAAKAELDAFAADKDTPITAVIKGKKKVYVVRNRY